MAINKRKILQSAQKHLQKGALDRALKDYKTLVEADPRDANVRLKVGDIYLRQGKTDEAVTAYLKVAQQFMKDGFDAKAVALFKQITKIDSKRFDIYVPLAELYQRLGLTSDAMRALQTAADAHYREGDKPAALEVLRKMATLDPGNTTNRLKVAELLRQEGLIDESLVEYRECAAELERQGEIEGQLGVLEKIHELKPDDGATLLAIGRAHVALRRWADAEKAGERIVEQFAEHAVEGCELLAEAYRGLRRDDALPDLYRRMAEVLRARGEEDKAREILQRYVPADAFAVGGEDVLETDEDLLLEDSLDAGSGDAPLEVDDDFPSEEPVVADPEPAPPAAPPEAAPAAASASGDAEGSDAEQLFAEASVYRRYGKNDRAVESLRAVLALEPQELDLLTRVGEAFEGCGATAEAVEAFVRGARCARDADDADAYAALFARATALDPGAAQELGGAPAPAPATPPEPELDDGSIEVDLDADLDATDPEPAAAPPEAEDDGDIEIDLEEPPDLGGEAPAAALQVEVTAPEVDVDADGSGGGVELEFDFDESDAGLSAPEADDVATLDDDIDLEATPPLGAEPDEHLEDDVLAESSSEIDVEIDLGETASPEPAAASAEPAGAESVPDTAAGGEFSSPQRLAEALEEAAFYLQQGLHDEAESVYRRILESSPNHPQAMLHLGEIEARRAEAGEHTEEIVAVSAPASDDSFTAEGLEEEAAEFDLDDVAASLGDDVEEEEEDTTAPAEAPEAVALAPEAPELESAAPEAGPESQAPEPEELPDATVPELPVPEEPTLAEAEAPEPPPVAAEEAGDGPVEVGESGDFDLAKELSGVFHEADPAASASGGTEEEGFEEVFAAFKKGVEETLGDEDHEAHYDLGIAYREMGLIDDAVGEFRAALEGSGRRLDALHMLGVCALDQGQAADAIDHLLQALAMPDVPAEQQIALRFDLGRAYEANGDRERAREAWEQVAAADPDFCDVDERLAQLDGVALPSEEAEEEDDFESFEDLVAEAEAEDEEPAAAEPEPEPEPSYESFDDLMAEAEDDEAEAAPEAEPGPAPVAATPAEPEILDPVEAEPGPEPEPEPEPAAEPEPEAEAEAPEAEAPKKGRGGSKKRRKKISFV